MSPEQARGETVDARADVFALGATLFYVLSGKLPWHGGSTEMIDHVGAGRPADWRLMPRDVPPDLRAIVEKAMAPNLVDRYPDATALAADLRQFTVGNLVAAYEYGPIARLARFIRRHRGAVLVGLISFLVLVIVGVISVRRVVAERDDANAARKLAEARQREARTAADRMLVTHARELVETDPVDAIAALRTLAPDSASWREAWSVAMAASLKGIPFGFVANSREPGLVQIASDDRRAFSVGLRTGHLKIIDIPSRTQRDLVALGPIHSATWFDPTHILITTAGEVALFDVDSGVRRKVLEGNVVTYSDRQGRAVFAVDRTLLELTDPAGTPRLIERDVDEYDPSPDLRAAMIRHGKQRVFLSGGKTYPVPDLPGEVVREPSTDIALVRDHLVARWRDNIVTIWDLRDDKLVERGHWALPKDMQSLAYTDGNVYMVTSSYYQRVGSTLPPARGPLNMSFSTRDGFLIAGSDGSVWIRDSLGVFRLGARHARYTRLDSAIDGRFIIAATQTGEVLLWDVSAVRPRSFLLERNEEPLMLDPTAIWTVVNAIGVFRIDRRTGARTVVADGLAPMLAMAVDVSVPLLVLHDEQTGVLRLVRPGFRDVVEPGVAFFGHGERSVVFVNGANELVQWTPESRERITTLSGRPTIVAVRAGYIAVVLDDTQLLRIETPT
ncbi:MAG TPA: hypothetical protein VLB44_01280, partial [Kofleriaceae bacterium]|nr:hypothetical protein [Kofleriaceae bacterium]